MERRRLPWWRPTGRTALHLLCLAPALILLAEGAANELGANPIEALIRSLGDWALRFLVLVLAVTPARRITGWNGLIRYRRMLGMWSFAYAVMHVGAYVALDQFFDWNAIGRDIVEHKFIAAGLAALLLLVPLAVTSGPAMIRRLGARRWRRVHRLIYIAAPLAALHYVWMVKADIRQPLIYAAILALLLGLRALWATRARMAASPRRPP